MRVGKRQKSKEKRFAGFAPKAGRFFVDSLFKTPEKTFYAFARFRFSRWLSENFEIEMRKSEPLAWLGCFFLAGIGAYFAAPQEPDAAVLCLVLAVGLAAAWRLRRHGLPFYAIVCVSAFLAGAALSALQTQWMATVMMERPDSVTLEGTIEDYEPRADGSKRLLLGSLVFQSKKKGAEMPSRVRLRMADKSFTAQPGDRVRLRARLVPAPGPAMPGGYDFSRDMFFKGIGATGFVYGKPERLSAVSSGPLRAFLREFPVARLRAAIAERTNQAFGANGQQRYAGLAAALLVGERGGVDPAIRETLIASGLAHILAISGLHMALVVASVVFSVRALLALHPSVALYYPIRTIAVFCGLTTGFAYFLLSGGSVSAIRAFLMVGIMALALLFGRRALSLRNVALACLGILLTSPFVFLGPGFQMSFAATLVLVAYSSWWTGKPVPALHENTILKRAGVGFRRYFFGLLVTSLLAGAASGLFAAFHFHRIAPLGLAANLLGLPVFSFIVMPSGFLGMIAMPFGYEAIPLKAMGFGLDILVSIGERVSALSGFQTVTGMLDPSAFMVVSATFVLLCIMKSQLRLLLLPVFVAGILLLSEGDPPDILIAEDGKTVAFHTSGGRLLVSGARAGRFEKEVWQKALAISGEAAERNAEKSPETLETMACDAFGCVFDTGAYRIAHVTHPSGFHEDCRRANLVISEFSAPAFCENNARTIDRDDLKSGGSHAVFLRATGGSGTIYPTVIPSIPAIKRPWHRRYRADNRPVAGRGSQ